jgi:hypothetical protein
MGGRSWQIIAGFTPFFSPIARNKGINGLIY